MAEDTNGAAPAAADNTPAPVEVPASMSAREAVGLLGKMNKEPSATPVEAGAAEQESAPHGDDAAAATEQPPGETTAESDPAAEPSVEPPKSWTKAEREAFNSLPREHQQAIAERERERETYYRKGHDEAAQAKQALAAEKQAAEQARQQYEAALPNLLQAIEQQVTGEFSDIKSWDDVNQLVAHDPVRYMQWDASQKRLQAVRAEADQVAQQKATEAQKQWSEFTATEDKTFISKAPEFSDPQKAAKLQSEAKSLLNDYGFTDDELGGLWNGQRGISLRDHRLQLIMRDATLLKSAKAQVAKAPPKPAPPVQRPGTAPAKGEATAEVKQALQSKLERSGDIKDAVKLLALNRKRA